MRRREASSGRRRATRALAVTLATLAGAPGEARSAPPPASGDDLALMVTRQGVMMRARFEERRLVARDASGVVLASREISPADRQQLIDTTRAALTDDAPQWSCPVDETFVSATVDGRTLSSAVCPERNRWRSHPELWQRLLTLLRRLLGVMR